MSDTSDYTIVGQPTDKEVPASMPSSSSHQIVGVIDEVREVQSLLRDCMDIIYEAHFRDSLDDGHSEERAKNRAYDKVESLNFDLVRIGNLLSYSPEEGYLEMVDYMTEALTEISSELVANGGNDYVEALFSQRGAIVYKSLAQAQQRLSKFSTQASMFRQPDWEVVVRDVTRLHALKSQDAVRTVANAYCALLPKYMRSVSAIYGSAGGMAIVYHFYVENTTLKKLDKGKEVEGNLLDKDEHGLKDDYYYDPKTTWWPRSGKFQMQVHFNFDTKVENKKRTWYQRFSGN